MLESNCFYFCDESNEADLTCTLLQMKQMVDEAIDLAYEFEVSSVAYKGVADDLLADRVGNVGVSAPTADRQTQAAPVLESGIAT